MATASSAATFRLSISPSSELTHLKSPFKLSIFTPLPSSLPRSSSSSFSVSCTIAKDPTVLMADSEKTKVAGSDPTVWQRPVSFGRFGKFSGKYVPETLMHALSELETAFYSLATDEDFQRELAEILKDYMG